MISSASVPASTRKVVDRTRGYRHGPITRLMSPSDLGERLKPFVFLDLFEADMRALAGNMPDPAPATKFVHHLCRSYSERRAQRAHFSPVFKPRGPSRYVFHCRSTR